MPPDWKSMFIRYEGIVVEAEGVNFLPDLDDPEPFSEEELAAIKEAIGDVEEPQVMVPRRRA